MYKILIQNTIVYVYQYQTIYKNNYYCEDEEFIYKKMIKFNPQGFIIDNGTI